MHYELNSMKTFYLVFLAMISLSLSNCSRDDDNNSGDDNSVKQKLIGKWYFSDPSVYGYNYNNSLPVVHLAQINFYFV